MFAKSRREVAGLVVSVGLGPDEPDTGPPSQLELLEGPPPMMIRTSWGEPTRPPRQMIAS
jgi:hypothetical protein